jgi:hypothetical protein
MIFWSGIIIAAAALIINFVLPNTRRVRLATLFLGVVGLIVTSFNHIQDDEARKPRYLTDQSKEYIIEKMRPFAGTTFDLGSNNDKEPLATAELIQEPLDAAGWKFLDWSGTQTLTRSDGRQVGITVDTGVVIGFEKAHESQLSPIAKALADALSHENISAAAKFTDYIPNNNHTTIHVIVGTKP